MNPQSNRHNCLINQNPAIKIQSTTNEYNMIFCLPRLEPRPPRDYLLLGRHGQRRRPVDDRTPRLHGQGRRAQGVLLLNPLGGRPPDQPRYSVVVLGLGHPGDDRARAGDPARDGHGHAGPARRADAVGTPAVGPPLPAPSSPCTANVRRERLGA